MPLTHIDLIGYAAAVCTTLAFVPQVLKIHRERSAYDISTGMYVVYIAGVGLWLAYGVLVASWPIILANAATICLAMAVLWMLSIPHISEPSGALLKGELDTDKSVW